MNGQRLRMCEQRQPLRWLNWHAQVPWPTWSAGHAGMHGLSLEVRLPTGVTRGFRAATPSFVLFSAADESMLSRIEEMLS